MNKYDWIFWLLALIAGALFAVLGWYRIEEMGRPPETFDSNCSSATGQPSVGDIPTIPSVTITCESGKEVIIDCGGDEVVVTGANEEGAKIFFEELLKPLVDDYINSQLNAWRDFELDSCYCGNKLKATSSWRLKDGFYFVCSKCGRIYAWGWANSEKENK